MGHERGKGGDVAPPNGKPLESPRRKRHAWVFQKENVYDFRLLHPSTVYYTNRPKEARQEKMFLIPGSGRKTEWVMLLLKQPFGK